MCFGRAVMALPDSPFWPPSPTVTTVLYATVFGTVTAWELRLLLVRGPAHRVHLHHAVGALAMLYMAAAGAASSRHGADGPEGPDGEGVLRQPGVMAGVRLTVGTGMLAMLLTP